MLKLVRTWFTCVICMTAYTSNIDLYGHRGGVLKLVPEHTIASYTLGAQQGADYLEPDIVLSNDGELIVLHGLELSETTDVASHPQFTNRKRSITVWKRGNPENYTNDQPSTIINKYQNITGWFVHAFTLNELRTLKKISQDFANNSTLNGIWDILTFNESLELTNKLSHILNRPIGIIPEPKHAEWFKYIGFDNFEYKVLESLRTYGFVYIDNGYYKPYDIFDPKRNVNKSSVILQSFAAEPLYRFNRLSNDSIPTMFLMETWDFSDKYGIHKNAIDWILSFARSVCSPKSSVTHLVDVRNKYNDLDFDICCWTLIDDVMEYVEVIDYGINAVFSNDVATGRVVNDILEEMANGNNTAILTSFCNGNHSENVTKIEIKWAVIGGIISLFIGALMGLFGFCCWYRHKLKTFASYVGQNAGLL